MSSHGQAAQRCAAKGHAVPARSTLVWLRRTFWFWPNEHRSVLRRLLPIVLERQLTIVLAQEADKPLVVGGLQVEDARHYLVVASRLFESHANQVPHVCAGDFPAHVQRIDGRPERLPFLGEAPVQVVDDRPATVALRAECDATLRANFRRKVGHRQCVAGISDEEPFDDVFQLSHVAGPGILRELVQDFWRKPPHAVAVAVTVLLRKPGHEMIDEGLDVLPGDRAVTGRGCE